jgi:hypothetical protein
MKDGLIIIVWKKKDYDRFWMKYYIVDLDKTLIKITD